MLEQKVTVFIAVVEQNGLSKAAVRLGLSPSSVSFHIDNLERELGVRLFERHGRHVELTEQGRLLYDGVSRIRTDCEKLSQQLALHSETLKQRIRLSGDALTCAFRMPRTIVEYKRRHPDTLFAYSDCTQDEAVEKLLTGELDIAFVGQEVRHRKLTAEPCYFDRIVLVGAAGPETPDRLEALELCNYPLIWYTHDAGLEQVVVKGLRAICASPKNLNLFMEVENLPILKNFVREGMGLSFLPHLVVEDELSFGQLKVVDVPGLELTRTTWRLYRKEDDEHSPLVGFIQFIEKRRREALLKGRPAPGQCPL